MSVAAFIFRISYVLMSTNSLIAFLIGFKVSENTIIDLPTGVVAFHMDQTEPRIPAVAVASGAHIYIYKNMKPYFKFTLPTLEIHSSERELWAAASMLASDGGLDLASLLDGLQNLRAEIGDSKLTARTQRLLMINDRQEAQVCGMFL